MLLFDSLQKGQQERNVEMLEGKALRRNPGFFRAIADQ
jgi:hypothetical protein